MNGLAASSHFSCNHAVGQLSASVILVSRGFHCGPVLEGVKTCRLKVVNYIARTSGIGRRLSTLALAWFSSQCSDGSFSSFTSVSADANRKPETQVPTLV